MIAKQVTPQTITLGGREFVPVLTSTIEHDYWLMSKIRAAGLDEIAKGEHESAEEFMTRLLHEVINAGVAFELLGGLLLAAHLVPEAWTPELAVENAEFIKRLTAPEDKATVQSQMISLLIGFFENGLSSLTISPSSSGEVEKRSRIAAG